MTRALRTLALTCFAAWIAAFPGMRAAAAPIRVETKGIPDDGGGRITRVTVPDFGERLDITLDVNVQFVPRQSDLDKIDTEMQLAQEILCDATDGRVNLVKARVNIGRAAADQSDIWWRVGIPQTSHGGNHIALNGDAFPGTTVAHELGHYLLNLRDSYQNRSGTDGCEWGPAFEVAARTPQNNTIMQTTGTHVCVDSAGRTHNRVDPGSFTNAVGCNSDADCPADGVVSDTAGNPVNWSCELDPLNSELGTRNNHDAVMGEFATRAPTEPGWTGACPTTGSAAGQVVIDGRLLASTTSTCGNGTLDATEECGDDGITSTSCDSTGRPGAADMTGTASCLSCRWNTSSCVLETCGNGETDANEECDPSDPTPPAAPSCTDLAAGASMIGGTPSTTFVGCSNNCTYDISPCPPRGDLVFFLSTCGNGIIDAPEQCDTNLFGPVLGSGTCGSLGAGTGVLTCDECWYDKSLCTGPTACNNDGVADPGEECDGTDVPLGCEDLGLGTGAASCNFNCTYNVNGCAHPAAGFDLTDFDLLAASSQVELPEIWLLDDVYREGARWSRGESERPLGVYANRVDADHWTLLFVMDAEHFGGAAETPKEIGRFDLEFDAGDQLIAINGEPVGADGCSAGLGCPQLVLGSAGATASFGSLVNGAQGQTSPTGAWAAMDDGTVAGPLTIDLKLGGISREPRQGTSGGVSYASYLRAEVLDAAGLEQYGLCSDDLWCALSWNGATQRFESTEQSRLVLKHMIEVDSASLATDADGNLVSDLAEHEERSDWWRLANTWNVPEVTNVDPGTPANSGCGVNPVEIDMGDVDIPGQFIMVLDRSGSMDAQAPLSTETRLALMQDAARNQVTMHNNRRSYDPDLNESDGSPCDGNADDDGDGLDDADDPDCQRPTRVGLVTFNEDTCVDASGDPVCVPLGEIGTGAGQTDPQVYRDAIDNLTSYGWTGIGTAMREAESQLDMSSAQAKALIVLSDGENNRPEGILCKPPADLAPGEVNDPACPYAVAEDLRNQGVMVITIPLGTDSDTLEMQAIAEMTGGEMLSAYNDDEVVPVFLHAYALSRGEKPVIARRDVRVTFEPEVPVLLSLGHTPGDAFIGEPSVTIPVPVEQGAQRLNLLLSVRDQDSSRWSPRFELRRPDGSLALDHDDPSVSALTTSRLVGVDDPVAGEWTMTIRGSWSVEQSHFAAHVENPRPGCSLKLSDRVTDGSTAVVAKVEAYYDTALRHQDVDYSLYIKSIDGTVTEITNFDTSDEDGPAVAVIDPSIIQYHGRYEVIASCGVGDLSQNPISSAERRRGEVLGGPEVLDFQSDPVPAFLREDRASVSVDNGNWPPLANCANDDCDRDGIPNGDEPPGDLDGDGAPCAWDGDCDGDDVPDSKDSDPTDPSVPGQPVPPGCSVDTTPPVISAPSHTEQGCVGPVHVDPQVSASDSSCPNDLFIHTTGQVIARDGQSLANPIPVYPDALTLAAGSYTIEWTATDVNGNSSSQTQSVTVTTDSSSPAACCDPNMTLIQGTWLPDVLVLPWTDNMCVFGYDGWDSIVTGFGSDYISGGLHDDVIESQGGGDVAVGGPGHDVIVVPTGPGGTLYGEAGNDVMELTGNGLMVGGPGNDIITGAFGTQVIVPGPGVDGVYAADGDDVVKIYDVCELQPLEVLDGSFGNDTLITPIPVAQMIAMGVIVVGFENVIVTDAERHLSECL